MKKGARLALTGSTLTLGCLATLHFMMSTTDPKVGIPAAIVYLLLTISIANNYYTLAKGYSEDK